MRLFSAWNYGTRQYDYYQAGEHQGTHITEASTSGLGSGAIGMSPDDFATRIPPGATRIGSGPVAKGQVASTGVRSMPWLLYGVVLYIAWRMFR